MPNQKPNPAPMSDEHFIIEMIKEADKTGIGYELKGARLLILLNRRDVQRDARLLSQAASKSEVQEKVCEQLVEGLAKWWAGAINTNWDESKKWREICRAKARAALKTSLAQAREKVKP